MSICVSIFQINKYRSIYPIERNTHKPGHFIYHRTKIYWHLGILQYWGISQDEFHISSIGTCQPVINIYILTTALVGYSLRVLLMVFIAVITAGSSASGASCIKKLLSKKSPGVRIRGCFRTQERADCAVKATLLEGEGCESHV